RKPSALVAIGQGERPGGAGYAERRSIRDLPRVWLCQLDEAKAPHRELGCEMIAPLEQLKQALTSDDAAGVREILHGCPDLQSKINEPIGPFDSPASVCTSAVSSSQVSGFVSDCPIRACQAAARY